MTTKLKKEIVSAQMQITRDVIGAWKSQILYTLNQLKIFGALEQQPQRVSELSRLLDIPEKALFRLLNAAVAVGYVLKDGEQYSNAPFIQCVMHKDAEGFLGNWLDLYAHWNTTFSNLTRAIREGKAIEDVNSVADENYHLIFINGMKDYASYRGRDILNHIDLSNVGNLLDIGCGPGIYAGMFCEKYPQLRCTCYDVPQALDLAREHLESKGVLDRVTLQPGNYICDSSFGEAQYDVVFLSHVLHQEDDATCAAIVRKAFNAVKEGGRIIIQAMFLNDSGTGPLYASLHDLLCLLIFPGGRNYTYQETTEFLTKAGFTNVRKKGMSIFNVNALLIGDKGDGL
jgi:2-polyprenyl-3-methyl-5-hydroxy-6-metoxy-1,4-benzoquinol methylase/DNA-binding HxlR family transcriptional regulator